MNTRRAGRDIGFEHVAVLYGSDEQLRERVMPYIEEGLRRDGNILVNVSAGAEQVLRDGLGSAASQVQWSPPEISDHLRLGQMYESYRDYLAEQHHTGAPTSIVAELDSDDDAHRVDQYLRYESMANEAYAPYGYPMICLWDERRYPPDVLARVRATHPQILGEQGHQVISADYREPADYLGGAGQSRPAAPATPRIDIHFDTAEDLVALRRHFRMWAMNLELSADEVSDVISAVDEVTTNALEHGGPPARVRSWVDGTTLVVQVDDQGRRPIPPTGGFHRPAPGSPRGRGLWMARQFADVVTIHSGSDGNAVSLRFPARRRQLIAG